MNKTRLVALLLLLGMATAGRADEVDKWLEEGRRFLRVWDRARAQAAYETALKEAERQPHPQCLADAHQGLGHVFYQLADYPAAQREFETAYALYHSVADRLGMARSQEYLAAVAGRVGDKDRARELYEIAIAEFDALQAPRDKAAALMNYSFDAPPEQRRAALAQGLDIARRIRDKELQGRILHAEGDDSFGGGDFARAVEKLESAATLLEEAGAQVHLARVLISLGRIHRVHGQGDRALTLYVRALEIQKTTDDKQGIIQTYNAMGVAYDAMGKHESSLEQYRKALTLAEETGAPRLINFLRGALAGALVATAKHAEAIAIFKQVLAQPIEPYLAAYRYGGLGQAYLESGQFADAVTALDRAVELSKKTDNRDCLLPALTRRAKAKAKLGRENEALADARENLQEIDKLRARLVPVDFMKRGFNDRAQEGLEFAIELQHKRGDFENALLDAERARARAFLDLLATRDVQVKPSNQEKLAEVRVLAKELQRQGIDPSRTVEPQSAQPTMRGHSGSLLNRWQRSELQLRSLVAAEPVSIDTIAAMARRLRSTVLIYWVSQERTYIWAIKPDGRLHSKSVAVQASHLDELVRNSWGGMGAAPGRGNVISLPLRSGDSLVLEAGDKRAWHELYRYLIKPVRDFLPPRKGSLLTIVPHGPLFRLSFAGLLDDSDRYLIESHSFHYAPSLSILEFLGAGHRTSPQTYLLVSNPRFEATLANLPGSEREVEGIARLLPPGAVTILTGAGASEESVRHSASKSGVLHFATHGIVRDDQVLDSFLALAGHDQLTAQEVYELDLAADLVVLSACRSGRGKVSRDGVAGLTRAFFYAGAASVLATLWDVADEPTSQLLRDFYQFLNAEPDKSRSLRNAQLSLLSRLRQGQVRVETPAGPATLPEHPVFWAGFVLQGRP